MEGSDEYVEVRYKVSLIRKQKRLRLFVALPFYIGLVVVDLLVIKSSFLFLLGIGGLCYSAWCHFYWRRVMRGQGLSDK